MPIWVAVEGAQQMRDLSSRLKKAGRGDLQKKLRRRIREAGQPAVRDLRAAALGIRVSSSKGGTARPDRSTGLRGRLSAAVGVSQTRRGIRIRVSARRMGEYGASLARYSDAEIRRYQRWRHPVFGQREVWVEQRGDPWFFVTIRRHRAKFRRAVFKAMDDTSRELTR